LGMAGPWDNIMKRLVRGYAKQFARWLVSEAVFVRAHDIELKNQHLLADALLEVILHGEPALLHIEFQSYDDPEMEMRLLEYNVLASRQNGHWPVYSYVIYLRKAREVAISPLVRTFPNGEEVHRFFFRVIKLWEVPAELLLQTGWIGVLPLVTLTDGGKRPEVVKEMVDRLLLAEEYDLLAISQVIGGLVFKTGPELEWFRKRFSMFQDILRESWVYQEIIEQGVEKGREEEREGRLQEQREMLMRLIQLRFPELEALAKQQSNDIMNPEILPPVNFKMLDAQTVEEARQLLLSINKGETKH
jgi:predicted transposase YdaD